MRCVSTMLARGASGTSASDGAKRQQWNRWGADTATPIDLNDLLQQGEDSMTVSTETRMKLYQRAGGRCECEMKVCAHHTGRCTHQLRGSNWHAHHRSAGGGDHLGNLIAMCVTCHKNTPTYGRPR